MANKHYIDTDNIIPQNQSPSLEIGSVTNRFGKISIDNTIDFSGSLFINDNGSTRISIDPLGSVGIGTVNADTSALLDLTSTTRGLLPPRMTTLQKTDISSPSTSLLVFDTNNNQYEFWNGSVWTGFGGTPDILAKTYTYETNLGINFGKVLTSITTTPAGITTSTYTYKTDGRLDFYIVVSPIKTKTFTPVYDLVTITQINSVTIT